MTKLGQGVEVRGHYPLLCIGVFPERSGQLEGAHLLLLPPVGHLGQGDQLNMAAFF